MRASITLSQPEGEHKAFHHIKQKTETIFDPQTKKTLTAPQTKQLSRLRRQREFLGLLGKGKRPRRRRQINPNGLSGKRKNLLHGPTGNENFNGLAGKGKLSATAPQAKKLSRPRRQRKLSRPRRQRKLSQPRRQRKLSQPRRQRKLSPPRRQRKNFHGPAGKEKLSRPRRQSNFNGPAGKEKTFTARQA